MSSVAKAHLQFGGARRLRPCTMHETKDKNENNELTTIHFEFNIIQIDRK